MTVSTSPAPLRLTGVSWRRAEFVLTGLAFLGFLTVPIKISTISNDLPAHPLFLHVPVVLIPLSILGALIMLARPRFYERHGILLCLCAIVAMSSIFLTMQAGVALLALLHLHGQALTLILKHQAAAHILAIVFTLFTAVLILNFASHRISAGNPTGLTIADAPLGTPAINLALKGLLLLLAVVSAYYVFRVGDLGARAVWESRLHALGR